MDKREALLLNNRFVISMGLTVYSFAKVSNLVDSYEVEAFQQGGSNRYPELVAKQKSKPETLILESGVVRGHSAGHEKQFSAGEPVKNVTIMVMDHSKVAKTYFFEHGIITKWEISGLDALGKDILIKKLEITHSGLQEVSQS